MGIPPHGPWALLGIAPTRQAREIKRAYAARLKTVRPDDDPAGFQALRQAYEWALAQCGAQPAPAPVVHFQIGVQTPPTYQIEIRVTPPTPPAPDALDARPEPLPVHKDSVPPPWTPQAPPSESGAFHWNSLLAGIGGENEDDWSHARIEALTAQLRACLRHPDLINFDAREAFTEAALSACAGERAPGALRLACDAAFNWSSAPMPLDPQERARWASVMERIAGDRQYSEMQALAQDAEPRRWVLQQLTQPDPPEIPWRRFFDARFRTQVRDSLRRIHTDWPLALQLRLNAASLPILEEAAGRPWPNFRKPSKPTWFALALIPAVTLALIISEPMPSRLIPGGSVLLAIAMWVASRAAYPLWILPAWRRLRQRAGNMRAALQLRLSHRHKARSIWFAVRIAAPAAAFFVPLLPPWYAEGVFVAIGAAAALHVAGLLLLGEIWIWIALLARILVVYGLLLGLTFMPFVGERSAFYLALLLLSDTLFDGLRNVLRQSGQPAWDTPRVRWILLASALVLMPLQWLLAGKLPALAALLGWGWFIAGCAAVDPFAPRATARLRHVAKFYAGICLAGISFAIAYNLIGANNPITGIISLQTALVIVTLITLANDWLDAL